MQVNTRFGPIQTERTLRVAEPDPTLIEVTERFRVPTRDGIREGVARRTVVRDLYMAEPTIVDEPLARDILHMTDDLAREVPPHVPAVDLPRLPAGGYLPPRPLAPTIDEILGQRPLLPIREEVLAQMNAPVRITMGGGYATTNALTWTTTDATYQAAVNLVAPNKNECSCGHPDDPNWEHAHDECTFLDRPSSQWRDEGREDNDEDDDEDEDF